MLHFTGIRTSWRGKLCILSGLPGGWDSFHSEFAWGSGWILWLVGSAFLMSRFCPAMAPITCGEYMQPVWVRATGVEGTCQVLSAGSPDFTHTNTFFSVPLSLTITSSDFCAVLWAFIHAGTADMSMVL